MSIVGYTYDASVHCPGHAQERFGVTALRDETATDNEGNPVHPIYSWDSWSADTVCDECLWTCIREGLPTDYARITT